MKIQNRLATLDGLRGLMCLWVLIGHTCRQTGLSIPVLRSPHYAVDGFMILSGFLMTYHALLRSDKEPWTKPGTWIAFYIRRYFRITPLYYLLLIPAYVLSDSFLRWRTTTDKLLSLPGPLENIPHITLQHLLLHLTYLFGLLPRYHASSVLPDWSLSLEMQFYLFFPLFMLFTLRFGWVVFALAASAIWLASTLYAPHLLQPFTQPSPLPLSLLWFVIGMLWAGAYLQAEQTNAISKVLFAAGLSLLSRDPHDIILVAVFAWALFAAGKASLGSLADFVRRALSGKLSGFLARASYSVYLTHLLILTPVAYFLSSRFHLYAGSRFLLAFSATAIASYGLARPLEVLENWGIQEGKRLSRRVSRPTSGSSKPRSALETGRTPSFLPHSNPVDV